MMDTGGRVAQLDRATVSGTVGRGFDSYRDRHFCEKEWRNNNYELDY